MIFLGKDNGLVTVSENFGFSILYFKIENYLGTTLLNNK